MIDLGKLVNTLTGPSSLGGGLAAGAAGGLMAGALTGKKGKKFAKSAVKVGGAALLGSLAWKAYQSYQANKPASNGSERMKDVVTLKEQDFALPDASNDSTQILLVRAMISAAMADGHIDSIEYQRIFSEIGEMGLSDKERLVLLEEMQAPKTIEELAARTDNLQTAMEVYAAALMVIDQCRPEGSRYLTQLARQLQLPEGLTDALRQRGQELSAVSAA